MDFLDPDETEHCGEYRNYYTVALDQYSETKSIIFADNDDECIGKDRTELFEVQQFEETVTSTFHFIYV